MATSADASWTAMPMWPSYVPIVQELLMFAVRGNCRTATCWSVNRWAPVAAWGR